MALEFDVGAKSSGVRVGAFLHEHAFSVALVPLEVTHISVSAGHCLLALPLLLQAIQPAAVRLWWILDWIRVRWLLSLWLDFLLPLGVCLWWW